MKEITEQNFDKEVLECELPVFACFITQWCHSCFPTCLIADDLVNRYEGHIKFVRIDKEKASKISDKYHITVVPSILIFQDSRITKKLLSYQDRTGLKHLLDALLAEPEAPLNVLEEHDKKSRVRYGHSSLSGGGISNEVAIKKLPSVWR